MQSYSSEQLYGAALAQFSKFGAKRLEKVRLCFDSFEAAFGAPKEMLAAAGIPENIAEEFCCWRADRSIENLQLQLERHSIHVYLRSSKEYPALLSQIFDPPEIIFARGAPLAPDARYVSIVGSRKATYYGRSAAEHFAKEGAERGATIVSGMAYGVDEVAHQAALKADGKTVAVLGCGILDKGTSRSRHIAEHIIGSGGTIVSEFPLQAPGQKHHFPYRNRVISGMSLATVVIEAAEQSGSLVTAKCAIDQNRELYAVPGPITSPLSAGTNRLIFEGCTPAISPAFVFDSLNLSRNERMKTASVPASSKARALLEHLTATPVHIDDLARDSGLSGTDIASTLTRMELSGQTKHIGGQYYVRS